MENKVPAFLLERPSSESFDRGKGGLKISFIEKGMHHVADVIRTGYIQWETASKDDVFQKIDARVKVLFLLLYIILVSLKKEMLPEILIGAFVFILAVIARLDVRSVYRRVFFFGFVFGFLIALPSAFNVVTNGEIIVPLLHLSEPHSFWIYRVPEEIGITREGVYGVVMLTSRVMNSLALSLFVLYTTSFSEIIKALKVLKVPDGFLMIITLSYKYMFIFAKTVEDIYLAKKSRLARQPSDEEARMWIAGRIAFIFKKTRLRCEEIFKAMVCRGFSGDIRFYESRRLNPQDWAAGGILLLFGIFFLWM